MKNQSFSYFYVIGAWQIEKFAVPDQLARVVALLAQLAESTCRLLRLDKEGIIEKLIVCQLRHQLVRFLKCSRQAQTSIQHFDQVLPHVAVHLYHCLQDPMNFINPHRHIPCSMKCSHTSQDPQITL